MNDYYINYLNGESHKVLITLFNSDSPLEYLQEIEKRLMSEKIYGNVLIDQILHVGNTQERFLSIYIDQNGFAKDTIEILNVPKESIYRKLSCDFLKKTDELEFSILSSVQKKMIRKGIVI